MHPILLHLPVTDRPLYTYSVLVLAACAVGLAVGARRARRHGLEQFDVVAAGLLAIAAGLVGAAALYVAIHWRAFLADPMAFAHQPGVVFYGGFIAAAGAALAYARAYRLPFLALADVTAVALPVGHAIGRVGCFFGGCCFGAPTTSPLGVRFPDPTTPAGEASAFLGALHPVQLYEAAGLLVVAALVALLGRRRRAPGMLMVAYVALYALLRIATELFRGDAAARRFLVPGVLSTSQAIALALLAAAAAGALVLRRLGERAS